ncbi:hypothetical protein CHU98_g899 [Xylaria longipes]|nr:hypothetical protein CHU98_g899 [Xylaria longipes]
MPINSTHDAYMKPYLKATTPHSQSSNVKVRNALLERNILVSQQTNRVPRDAGVAPPAIPTPVDSTTTLIPGRDALDQALEGRELLLLHGLRLRGRERQRRRRSPPQTRTRTRRVQQQRLHRDLEAALVLRGDGHGRGAPAAREDALALGAVGVGEVDAELRLDGAVARPPALARVFVDAQVLVATLV